MDLPDPGIGGTDDALAQPTRRRLFVLLGELKRSASTDELADRIGLHPNGARFHLDRLEDVGLVVRTRVRQARGRPRDAWAIAPDARPAGRSPRAYADLSRWLTRAINAKSVSLPSIERAGRAIGRELAPADAPDGTQALATTLAALGFQPTLRTDGSDALTFCLGNCPYRDAVRENQPLICALHKGITRGLIDVLKPNARLAEFEPRDPDRAGCLIGLHQTSRARKIN